MAVILKLFFNTGLKGEVRPEVKTNVMPIAVEAVSLEKYLAWLNEQA
jgi:hypothetical protein